MAVNFSSGFNITSNEAVDQRIIKTKAEMRNMSPADLARMPDKYFCMCADDGQIYFYDKEGGFKPETGYFTAFDSTVADDIKNSEEVQGALTDNIIDNIGENQGVQGALTNNIINNIGSDSGVQGALTTNITNNIANDTNVQSALGSAISGNEVIQSAIGGVITNNPDIHESIAGAISSSDKIQEQIDKTVQDALDSGTVEVKTATNIAKGIVVGDATGKNKISVDEDGEMEINSVGVEKLSNTEGVRLILNGGKAPVIG